MAPRPKKNQMTVNGRDVDDTEARLGINLADDFLEVRGFGKPVTRARARQMASDYFKDVEAAEVVIQEIETNKKYAALRDLPEFQTMKDLLDPETQTVSGVFGKEIILQILSMRHCEGIRYIIGKDKGKNTVILIGVQEVESQGDNEGGPAMSAPVALKSTGSKQDVPVDAEVHESSLNMKNVKVLIAPSGDGGPASDLHNSRIDLLFGTY